MEHLRDTFLKSHCSSVLCSLAVFISFLIIFPSCLNEVPENKVWNSVSGTITDSLYGQPLKGAVVSTVPAAGSALTDSSGRYTITNIPSGSYTLVAALEGYISNSAPVQITSNGNFYINISLQQTLSIDFIHIDGAYYQMGDEFDEGGGDDERPVHTVQINSYSISRTEITFEQYDKFCNATGRNRPSDNGWGRGNRPVINVTWDDAVAFCTWAGTQLGRKVRLPTEAEWEYAARAGLPNIRFAGTNRYDQINDYFWYNLNSGDKTNPVGQKLPNAFGLYDMSGNVLEWCSDWYERSYYNVSPVKNPQGPATGVYRVLRGGAYMVGLGGCRVATRNSMLPETHYNFMGFRVVSSE